MVNINTQYKKTQRGRKPIKTSKKVSMSGVSCDEDILKECAKQAEHLEITRSEFVNTVLRHYLYYLPADEITDSPISEMCV